MNLFNYEGWELKYFDTANHFRNYQFSLFKSHLSGLVGEIGPGNGVLLDFYIKYVDKINLFEPSKNFLKALKKKSSNNEKVKIFNSYFIEQQNTYDVLLYLDVLEHIEDDYSELHRAYNSLKVGGKLIINVPAFNFLYSDFDQSINHFRRYTKNNFLKTIKPLKFQKIDLKYYDVIGFFLSLFSKFTKQNFRENFDLKIKIWNKLIPFSKFLDFVIFHKLGKSLLVVCVK